MPQKRLLFLCGGLQPGADGVGDYVRQLSKPLSVHATQLAACSLHDPHVQVITPESALPRHLTSASDPCFLRLPSRLSWEAKALALQDWLKDWAPDYISLQYVPYAFHDRGLPLGLPRWLKRSLPRESRWHIMFHETWIGITFQAPWRQHLIGQLQLQLAQYLVRHLDPVVCHTSNSLYENVLAKAGIVADGLPICANIAKVATEHTWITSELASLGILPAERSLWHIAGMFGSCHDYVPLIQLAHDALQTAQAKGLKLALLGIGGGSGTGASWEQRLRNIAPAIPIRHFGRQSDARISAFLSALDSGLPNTPLQYRGKSGSCAAMIAHGIPMSKAFQVDLPEYRGRCGEHIPDADLFLPPSVIAERLLTSLTRASDSLPAAV